MTWKGRTAAGAAALLLTTLIHAAGPARAQVSPPCFSAVVLAQRGGHHAEFVATARAWLSRLSADSNFVVDYIQSPDSLSRDFLARYSLFIQLDYPPYGWNDRAQAAFSDFIEEGRGGWLGLHHATLLGEFDGYPMWEWFSRFMGGVRFVNYIASFAAADVIVEEGAHPLFVGVPPVFRVQKDEWYVYDRSPRADVRVLARVNEESYVPASTIRMGDHPVIWTNEHVRARNVYIFMGHDPGLFRNPAYTTLLRNAIFWAAGHSARPADPRETR